MYAYKKLTAQDVAVVPFNAHKQYDFDSASCSTHKIDHYSTQWTSESISLYTSTSAVYGGDVKNVVKYQQLDHLFYREFPSNHSNTLGSAHYLKHKRNLYEKANILSIPTGLYGYEIKPGSFYIKTSDGTEVVDDLYGNLLISGTFTSSDYPVDVRGNVFRLDPIKGFKDYDLGVYKDYALKFINPQFPEAGMKKVFYKRGEIKANTPSTYSTPDDIFETDDSYFYNSFKYNRINFTPLTESELVDVYNASSVDATCTVNSSNSVTFAAGAGNRFADNITPNLTIGTQYKLSFTITGYTGTNKIGFSLNGGPSSNARLGENGTYSELFISDGNQPDVFAADGVAGTISNISVKEVKSNQIPSLSFNSITGSNVVSEHNERYNFNRDDDFAISFYMEPRVLSNPAITAAVAVGDTFQGGRVAKIDGDFAYITHTSPITTFWGVNKYWGAGGTQINGIAGGVIGDGEAFTQAMADDDPTGIYLGTHINNITLAGYSDWWLPTKDEIFDLMLDAQHDFGNNFTYDGVNTFNDLGITRLGTNAYGNQSLRIISSNDTNADFRIITNPQGTSFATSPTQADINKSISFQNTPGTHKDLIYPIRKTNITTFDESRRYI